MLINYMVFTIRSHRLLLTPTMHPLQPELNFDIPANDFHQRQKQVDRTIAALYRWYVAKSQPRRTWNADTDFDWRSIRRNLPEDILRIVQGYYAVEQFVPDYAAELVSLLRRNYGRSQFYLKWGAEESKHADLWQNVLLSTGYRGLEDLEEYSKELRSRSWKLPFDDPIEMLVYTVFQERATQVNYTNLRSLVDEKSQCDCSDPVLAAACQKIAADEVAHFEFFLSATQIYLYYFPERTLHAIAKVLAFFEMPAASLIADYQPFIDALYRRQLFGKKTYFKEVVCLVCEKLAVRDLRLIDGASKRLQKPPVDGDCLPLRPQDLFDFETVQTTMITLFTRLGRFEIEAGIEQMFDTGFLLHAW